MTAAKSSLIIEEKVVCSMATRLPKQFVLASKTYANLGMSKGSDRVTANEFREYFLNIVSDNNINVLTKTTIESIDIKSKLFNVNTNSGIFSSKKIVLATGKNSFYKKINLGEDNLKNVIYGYMGDYYKKNISVIGGGNGSASLVCDLEKNNNVSWIFRRSQEDCLKKINVIWREHITSLINQNKINIYEKSKINKICDSYILFKNKKKLNFDFCHILIGYDMNKNILYKFYKDKKNMVILKNGDTMATNIENVYLFGTAAHVCEFGSKKSVIDLVHSIEASDHLIKMMFGK